MLFYNPLQFFYRKKVAAVPNETFGYKGTDLAARKLSDKEFQGAAPVQIIADAAFHVDYSRKCNVYLYDTVRTRYAHVSPIVLKYNKENGESLPAVVLYDDQGVEISHFHALIVDGKQVLRVDRGDKKIKKPGNIEGQVYLEIKGTVWAFLDPASACRLVTQDHKTRVKHGCYDPPTYESVKRTVPVRFEPELATT